LVVTRSCSLLPKGTGKPRKKDKLMAKNMTRKSLAVAVSGLLVSVSLTAAPAYAAAAVSLTDRFETGKYTMIGGENFTLTGKGNADFVGAANKLRFKLTNIDGVAIADDDGTAGTVSLTTDGGSAVDVGGANQATKADGSGTDSSLGSTADSTAVFALANGDGAAADAGADGASIMTSPVSITFTSSPADNTTARYKVEFFYDADNDGVVDTDELVSSQTVTFVHVSDIASSLTIDAATEGDETVSGSFNFTNIDGRQLTLTEVGVYISDGQGNELANDGNADAVTEALLLDGSSDVTYDTTDKRFEFVTDALNTQTTGLEVALVKDTAVKAQPTYKTGGSPAKADVRGSAVTLLVAARKAATIVADTVLSTTAALDGNADGTANVALNSSYQVEAVVEDADGEPVSGVAVTAKVTVAGATLAASPEVSVTVGSTKYTSAASLPGATGVARVALTTDAAGKVRLSLSNAGFTNGQDVVVEFKVENLTDTITANNATLTYTANVNGAISGTTTTDGTAANIRLSVRDQFGGKPANSKYRVSVDFVSSTQTTAATDATETFANVVDGEATLSITDNGTGTGTNIYDIDLDTIGNNGAVSASNEEFNDFDIFIVAAGTAVGTVTLTDTGNNVVTQNATTKVYTDALVAGNNGSGELLLSDIFAYDPVADLGRIAAPTVSSAAGAEIAGNVKTLATATAAAAAVPNALVTISAPGLLLNYTGDDSKEYYAVGSITVPAANDGTFVVTAWSNKSGKHTVTVTSNGVSATLVLDKFDAPATTTGTSLVITAPAAVPAGSTVIATALLTDKYGNPVATTANADGGGDFSMTYSGPGLAVTASADATDADGGAKVAYFLGSNDTGTITITAKYDKNGDEDYADTGDLTVTKTIYIGSAPVAAKVNVGSFNGKLVVYANGHNGKRISWKVGGRWGSAVADSNTDRFSRPTPRKGVTVSVQIYVDGVLTLTKSVVTK
jgi:adhesin/invasin